MARLTPGDCGYDLINNLDLQRLIADETLRFVVCGHTHHRMVRHFERRCGRLTIINAGALNETEAPCCALLNFEKQTATLYEFVGDEIGMKVELKNL